MKEGGAIFYNFQPPTTDKVIFNNNSAPYGNNFGSYPYRIGLVDSTQREEIVLNDIGSGIVFETPLKLALFDFNNQVMVLDSSSQFIIVPGNSSKGTISGFNTAVTNKGISTFEGLSIVAKPGSKAVKFIASTKSIDKNKIFNIFNISNIDQVIVMNFRF